MLIPSHALLAKRVNDYIEIHYGVRLASASLYYGSIAPDLFDKDKGSHYAPSCLGQISKLLESIEVENDDKAFCHLLGEVLHFVVDYFTAAHNKPYLMNNMRLHMMYETQLHFLLVKEPPISTPLISSFDGDLLTQLEQWHDVYALQRSKASRDLDYITQACCFVAGVLVENRLHLLVPEVKVAVA